MGTHPPSATVYVAYCTCPNAEVGSEIARQLVEERLAACVNMLPNVVSVYRWGAQVETDQEVLLMIKTTALRVDALSARITALHPYDVPEIIAHAIAAGHENYLDWVRQCTATTT